MGNSAAMKVGPELLKILSKPYAPDQLISQRFGRYDLAFKTDEQGRPILLFIGKADAEGKIKGGRFARRLQEDKNGEVIKDHWDNKGKTG
jgi:hypothetical protein